VPLAGIEFNKLALYLKQFSTTIKKDTNRNTLKIVRLGEMA